MRFCENDVFTMINRWTTYHLLLSALLLSSYTSEAQNRVVVVPLFEQSSGSDSSRISNVVTVAKQGGDFDDPRVAIASITDASETNPYIIIVDLGSLF